jgi:hypothetical protein
MVGGPGWSERRVPDARWARLEARWCVRPGLGELDLARNPPRLVGRVWGGTGEPGRPLGVAVMPLSADAGAEGATRAAPTGVSFLGAVL